MKDKKRKEKKREEILYSLSYSRFFYLPTGITTRKTGLDVGRVEHHTDRGAERLRGEVVAELSADNAGVAYFS